MQRNPYPSVTHLRQSAFQVSTTKRIAHQLIMEALDPILHVPRRTPRIFTLPGDSLVFEHMLHTYLDGRVELCGVERDPQVFELAQEKAKSLGIPFSLFCESDFDYWSSRVVSPFDAIWLDYCGPWAKDKFASIEAIFGRDWLRFDKGQPNPLLCFTFMEGMDLHSFQELLVITGKAVGCRDSHRNTLVRMYGIPKWINEVAKFYGKSAELKMVYRYKDRLRSQKARPMLLFVLEIHPTKKQFDVWKAVGIDLIQDCLRGSTRRFQ